MSISLSLAFDTLDTAIKALELLKTAQKPSAVMGGNYEIVPKHEPAVANKPAEAAATQHVAAPAEQKPVETAPAANDALTIDDVKASFRAYVERGQGRTAATAKAILTAHGLAAIRDARPEQFAVLKRAFETAGPDMPLGEAA